MFKVECELTWATEGGRQTRLESVDGLSVCHHSHHFDRLHNSLNSACYVAFCGHADENRSAFPGKAPVIYIGFDDPPKLAMAESNEVEALDHYRRVRDEIRKFVAYNLLKATSSVS